MNPQTGAIYAMASSPTYSPKVHIPPYKGSKVLNPNNPLTPGYDKAFQGTYPAGSTFKPITATAAFQSGILAPGQKLECPGYITSQWDKSADPHKFFDWTPLSMGAMNLSKALEVSCDTFFYQLGDDFWVRRDEFQGWIRRFGYGQTPPLDAGGAQAGIVPDRVWKADQTWPGTPAQQGIEQIWEPGDDITMAIGQGNLLVSPLPAGGRLQRAQERRQGRDPARRPGHPQARQYHPGDPGRRDRPEGAAGHEPEPDAFERDQAGLYGATHAGDGTSSAIFGNFQPTVYGKTGTAEVPTATCPNCSDAWWAGWASQGGQSLVVVAFIHNGGHGGVSAAPVAASVFQEFFSPNRRFVFHAGSDRSR